MCQRCVQINEDIAELKDRLSRLNCQRARNSRRYAKWYAENRARKIASVKARQQEIRKQEASRA